MLSLIPFRRTPCPWFPVSLLHPILFLKEISPTFFPSRFAGEARGFVATTVLGGCTSIAASWFQPSRWCPRQLRSLTSLRRLMLLGWEPPRQVPSCLLHSMISKRVIPKAPTPRLTGSPHPTARWPHLSVQLIGALDEKGQPDDHEDASCAEDVDVVLPVVMLGRSCWVHCRCQKRGTTLTRLYSGFFRLAFAKEKPRESGHISQFGGP